MPDRGVWWSETAYEYIDDLDPSGIAWEFLRRNSEYQQDFRSVSTSGPLSPSSALALARKWGLPFCDRSRTQRTRGICLLDPFRGSGHHSAFGSTKGDG